MSRSRKCLAIFGVSVLLSFWAGYVCNEADFFAEKVIVGTGDCQITFIWNKVQYQLANGETEKIAISEAFSAQPDLKTFQSLHEANLLNRSRLPFSCYYKDNKFVYGYTPGRFAAILKDFDYASLQLIEGQELSWDAEQNCGIWDCYEDEDSRYIITELASQNYLLEGRSTKIKK